MSWNLHVDYICARANVRLHYLKRLKRVGLPTDRLAIWYSSVIRPCSWILHGCLAPRLKVLSDRSDWNDPEASYSHYLSSNNVYAILHGWCCSMLSFRLSQISATNSAVIFSSNCSIIDHLLPPRRDSEITSRLTRATTYLLPRNCTNCYKSFIHHALIKYQ